MDVDNFILWLNKINSITSIFIDKLNTSKDSKSVITDIEYYKRLKVLDLSEEDEHNLKMLTDMYFEAHC